MNYGLHRLFLLAYLTELFVGQDYLARINLSQEKERVKAGGESGWNKHVVPSFPRV